MAEDYKPWLYVLAGNAAMARDWIQTSRAGERFRPRYVGWPQGLRGVSRFVVLPSFAERQDKPEEWATMLGFLRESEYVQEYKPGEIEAICRS